ncbi:MAG: hypothetical protein KAT86_05950 [Candidatus Latescibacteria bacterium]|nr:hypothetical protein [Candidatus Latescibacterota bacterium]
MTSRERVRRAVLFQGPDRVPIDLPEPYGTDFLQHVGIDPDPSWQPKIDTETRWEDEWGSIWEKLPGDVTMGQVKYHPLSDYSHLQEFRFPDYKNPQRYETARKVISENKEEKFVLAGIPFSIIHRLEYLRGHQEAWTDSYLHPRELEELLDRLADIAIDSIENLASLGVDGIISADDWGLQDRPMLAPEIFRKFFKPRYNRVYSFAHQQGMLTFLHSCGYIIDLLEDFIEAKLDLIQMDQQENMGVERLSELFGGRLCFWCPVDIQKTLQTDDPAKVEAAAKEYIEKLGSFGGGFVAGYYGSNEAIGVDPELQAVACRAFMKYGDPAPTRYVTA